MTGKTGEKVAAAGKYQCQTHPGSTIMDQCQTHPGSTIMVKVGDVFPKCSFGAAGIHDTVWVKQETT